MKWKQQAKEAWMEAKRQEDTSLEWGDSISQRLAERQFEQWWERNYE
jgi:hypothetical protein